MRLDHPLANTATRAWIEELTLQYRAAVGEEFTRS